MRGIITLVILVALIGIGGAYGLHQSVKNPKPVECTVDKLPTDSATKWVTISGGKLHIKALVIDLEDTPSPALRRVLIPYTKDDEPASVVVEIDDQERLEKLNSLLIAKKADEKIDYTKVAEIVGLKDNIITGMLDTGIVNHSGEESAVAQLLEKKLIDEAAVAVRAGAKPPGIAFSVVVIIVAIVLLIGGIIFLKRTEGNADEIDDPLTGLIEAPSSAETRTVLTESDTNQVIDDEGKETSQPEKRASEEKPKE